jgi:mono/diheme cytochrome c family protein
VHHLKVYIPLAALTIMVMAMIVGGCELLDPNPGPRPVDIMTGDSTPVDHSPATAARGKEIYAQDCARCHGDSAEGTQIWRPAIQGRLGIHEIVRTGRRAMPAFPLLSDSAIASVELFLGTFPVDFASKTNAELFTIFCSGCHGDSATGSSVFAGNIQGHDSIHDIVRNGRGDMFPVQVPDSIITRIQSYLLSYHIDLDDLNGVDYFAHICAGCHGASGEGTTRGYEIRNTKADYATYVIRNGRPGVPYFRDSMPKYTSHLVSDAQLNAIISFLRSAPKPVTGMLLYNRFCASCHGYDGKGGVSGKALTGKGFDAFEEGVRLGKGDQAFADRRRYMPAWTASEISADEIRLITTYVRSLD